MALFIASLNSGSNGNCYYVGNSSEAVLIDAGLSCRETEKRLVKMGLNIQKVKAIFISHEHSDHIKGVEVLSKKHRIPVFISEKTLHGSGLKIQNELIRLFQPNENIMLEDLQVHAFKKYHDAADPYSFVVSGNDVRVGVFTDIGHACNLITQHFRSCHAVFLEANYCETMLAEGHYPFYLKRRISSDVGHLSNTQALRLFLEHKPEYMSHVFLSHLSRENNSPSLVQKLFEENCGNVKVVVASRDYETEVFTITSQNKLAEERLNVFSHAARQASLF